MVCYLLGGHFPATLILEGIGGAGFVSPLDLGGGFLGGMLGAAGLGGSTGVGGLGGREGELGGSEGPLARGVGRGLPPSGLSPALLINSGGFGLLKVLLLFNGRGGADSGLDSD